MNFWGIKDNDLLSNRDSASSYIIPYC